MTENSTAETVLRGVLDAWQKAIADHDSDLVAKLFAGDAVFQGLRPYSVGRAGVAEYYASQPLGMTVDYRVQKAQRLAPGVVLGWVAADFSFVNRDPVLVNLTVVLRDGQIEHYHVSPRING